MAVKIQVRVFWIVMLCSVVIRYQSLGGSCCLHLQCEVEVEAEAASSSSQMMVPYHNTKQCHNPEDLDFNNTKRSLLLTAVQPYTSITETRISKIKAGFQFAKSIIFSPNVVKLIMQWHKHRN